MPDAKYPYSIGISLDDVPEVEPTNEETTVLNAYELGVEEYQPCISEDDLRRELGI